MIKRISIHPVTAYVSFKMASIPIPLIAKAKMNLSFQSHHLSSYREVRCISQPFLFKRLTSGVLLHILLACAVPFRVQVAADLLLNKQYFEIMPKRPRRFLHPDGIVRSFILYESQGASLLKVYNIV